MNSIKRLFQRSALALNLAILLCLSQMGFPALAYAQPQSSPFIETESVDYPDGSQWAPATYEPISGTVALQGRAFSAMGEPEIGFGTAALVQPQLPEGFTLQPGTTSHIVIGEEPTAKYLNSRERKPADADEVIDPEQAEQLRLDDPHQNSSSDKWFVTNAVAYQGIPLAKFSDVLTIVNESGEAQYVRKRNLPVNVDATNPTVTAEQAIELAKQDAGDELIADQASLEIWVDQNLQGHLTWTVTLSSPSLTEPQALRYWVTAINEPEILYRESQIFYTHQGTITGNLWSASPFQGTENRPLGDLRVSRSAASGGGNQVTNRYGLYGFTTGSGTATIDTNLSGPNSVIQNDAGAVLNQSRSGTLTAPIDLNLGAATEAELAQVSAFYWTNLSHQLSSTELDPNLPSLPTRVNINSSCNAFWNGSSINFFRAGGSCPNTAYADVVLHEYGHGVDARQGGILDGGYSEGFGDALAILGTRQSCLGRDFLGSGTCLRPATDVILWPPAPGEGVHAVGRRYAGFTWELIQQLRKTYSEDGAYQIATGLVLAAAAANPANVPDAVLLSFIADDDDGTLSNGTPHFAELAAAADSRNIPRPAGLLRERVGYAWANNPTAASYTPMAAYAYNSSGGAITINRSSVGRYVVQFAGLGGGSSFGGSVQVTSYGGDSASCKVQSWGSGGSNFVANVNCFSAAGAPVDSRYTVLVSWH
jgi:Zn-dependent metalloprotease